MSPILDQPPRPWARGGGNAAPRPWLRIGSAVCLLAGIAALAWPPAWTRGGVTWEGLLAPYSQSAALPHDFRIDAIQRGTGNDVLVSARRPGEQSGVEIHILERGRWPGVRESRSFTIAYETPRSPAAEREEITEAVAEAVRQHDDGLPSPDAIPLDSSDRSSLPWVLEMLRGGRGLLLGASLAALGLVAVGALPSAWRFAIALAAADVALAVLGVSPGRPDLGRCWLVPGAALLLFAGLRGRASIAVHDCLEASSVFVLGLILRLALGPWGPLHANGMGAMWIAGAAGDSGAVATYGPGFVELFTPIALLAPSNPDVVIFAFNALLSALVPGAAFALARTLAVERAPALAAASLLAIDPVAIRTAATESYFPAIILLCTVAALALAAGASELDRGNGRRGGACVIGAGLLLAQALRMHPAAWGAVATVPLISLAAVDAAAWRRVAAFGATSMVVVGLMVTLTGGELLDVFGRVRSGTLMTPFAPPSLAPLVWVAGFAVLYFAMASRPWLAIPAAVCLGAMFSSRHLYDQSRIWQESYERLYLTLPVIAASAAVPAAWLRRRPIAVGLFLLAGIAWLWFGWPIVSARTTDHLEYRWLRSQIASLSPECRVIHLAAAGKRGLFLPTFGPLGAAVAIDPRRPKTFDEALSPAGCLYYVHTSLCSSAEGRPECESFERRLTLVPVARAEFPASPSHQGFPYDRDPVETVLYRVEGIGVPGPTGPGS